MLACIFAGSIIAIIGSSLSDSSVWYVAIPAVVAVGWLFVADPTECAAPPQTWTETATQYRAGNTGATEVSGMKPRITVITVCVDDLERSLEFYRDGLGLKTEGIIGKEFEHGAVAFFDLQAGLKLALWPRSSLAHDSGLPLGAPSATELSLGHNVSSKAEVDVVMAQAKRAGAVIVKPAQDTFWGGYAGYFQDPDQHLWEIVWNPQWALADEA